MRVKQIIVTAAALLAVGITSIARAEGIAVGGKVSTLGYGAELGYRFNDWIGVRAGINGGSYDFDGTDAGVDYRYSMDFDTVPVLLDWHVFGGTFRLTGGLVRNNNKLSGTASGLLDIGNGTYNTTVTSNITFDKSSKYLGLGWGGLPSTKSGFGMALDIGVLLHGSPTASLTAPGVPQADIDREVAALNEDLKDLKYWPVLTLTIGYTF